MFGAPVIMHFVNALTCKNAVIMQFVNTGRRSRIA